MLAQRITNYSLEFNLLSQCQYGFRENYSTITAIADIFMINFSAIMIT